MKTLRKISAMALTFVIAITMFMPRVSAHEIEKETNGVITFPLDIHGNSKINVKINTDYVLSYQLVKISSGDMTKIEALIAEYETYREESYPGENPSVEASEEYQGGLIERSRAIDAVKPAYDDSKWQKAGDDDRINFDTSAVKGNDGYVLWVKVEAAGKTFYNEAGYNFSTDGTGFAFPHECVDIVNDPPVENPQTGDNLLLLGLGAIALVGIGIVSARKLAKHN